MKNILLFLVLTISTLSFAQESNWINDIDQAKKTALENQKYILMSFSGSDWCANCIKLDKELFQTEDFQEFSEENLVLLKVDFPAKKANLLSEEQTIHNEGLAERYNKKGTFPAVYIVDEKGSIVAQMEHPQASIDDYMGELKKLIAK